MEAKITTKGSMVTRIDQTNNGFRLSIGVQRRPNGTYTMGRTKKVFKTLSGAEKANERYLAQF